MGETRHFQLQQSGLAWLGGEAMRCVDGGIGDGIGGGIGGGFDGAQLEEKLLASLDHLQTDREVHTRFGQRGRGVHCVTGRVCCVTGRACCVTGRA